MLSINELLDLYSRSIDDVKLEKIFYGVLDTLKHILSPKIRREYDNGNILLSYVSADELRQITDTPKEDWIKGTTIVHPTLAGSIMVFISYEESYKEQLCTMAHELKHVDQWLDSPEEFAEPNGSKTYEILEDEASSVENMLRAILI